MQSILTLFSTVDIEENELKQIIGVFDINAHEVPSETGPRQAIYKMSSLIEHSCVNNCSKHFDANGNIIIRAATFIKKGDRLSINYSDPIWGTATRQIHLKETKHFTCTCRRCKDPTELGTFYSGIKCFGCESGYFLSKNPIERNTGWSCNKCEKEISSEEIDYILKQIGEDLIALKKNDVEASYNFLKNHSKSLHQNHYYLTEVKLALCQLIGQSCITERDLNMCQEICKDLLKLVDKLSPGKLALSPCTHFSAPTLRSSHRYSCSWLVNMHQEVYHLQDDKLTQPHLRSCFWQLV